jgi:hypothetical protein
MERLEKENGENKILNLRHFYIEIKSSDETPLEENISSDVILSVENALNIKKEEFSIIVGICNKKKCFSFLFFKQQN